VSSWFQSKATSTKFVVASLVAACLLSQRGTTAACNNYYTTAVDLLQALYPDLKGKNVSIQTMVLEPFDSDKPPTRFAIAVSEVPPAEPITAAPAPPPLSSAERVGHLSTHFEFDPRDGKLIWMFANGSYVSTDKQQQLQHHIEEDPNWPEHELTEALKAAGAKFGPNQRDAVLAVFPRSRLEPILGKIEIQSVKFGVGPNNGGQKDRAILWSVRFQASKGQATTQYFASLEPFAGRVVLLGSTLFEAGHVAPKT
jgi:hypothetical protein